MRIVHRCGYCLLTFVIAIANLGAVAQNGTAKLPKEFIVGISLDSNYARITDFLPALRDSLLKDIPRRQKQSASLLWMDYLKMPPMPPKPRGAITCCNSACWK